MNPHPFPESAGPPEGVSEQDILDGIDWRDPLLDRQALVRAILEGLAAHPCRASDAERRLLAESWAPGDDASHEGHLAMHFMRRFAPVAQRLPRGLAYTAITTLRLEHPIGQQEDFNRAMLLYCQWATREIERLGRRVAELEGAGAGRTEDAEAHS